MDSDDGSDNASPGGNNSPNASTAGSSTAAKERAAARGGKGKGADKKGVQTENLGYDILVK